MDKDIEIDKPEPPERRSKVGTTLAYIVIIAGIVLVGALVTPLVIAWWRWALG